MLPCLSSVITEINHEAVVEIPFILATRLFLSGDSRECFGMRAECTERATRRKFKKEGIIELDIWGWRFDHSAVRNP
jgi:hypothetical protein